jgi:hypothetical protein
MHTSVDHNDVTKAKQEHNTAVPVFHKDTTEVFHPRPSSLAYGWVRPCACTCVYVRARACDMQLSAVTCMIGWAEPHNSKITLPSFNYQFDTIANIEFENIKALRFQHN